MIPICIYEDEDEEWVMQSMGRRVICAFSGAGEDDEAGAADEACSDTE